MSGAVSAFGYGAVSAIVLGCVIVGALGSAHCGWDRPVPATPDQPCGAGVQCFGADGGATGFCCGPTDVCGGDPAAIGCPPDRCCDAVPLVPLAPDYGGRLDLDAGAARRVTGPQSPAR